MAYSESGSGERLAHHHIFGQSELAADFAYFVFKESAQWFEQFEFHFLGESADVVMTFDHGGWVAVNRHRLNHIGVGCPLSEENGIFNGVCSFVKDLDELSADNFAFTLRFFHSGECVEEPFSSVDIFKIDFKISAV